MTAALLIIDIQNEYFPGDAMEVAGVTAAAAQAARLLAALRQRARPVILRDESKKLCVCT